MTMNGEGRVWEVKRGNVEEKMENVEGGIRSVVESVLRSVERKVEVLHSFEVSLTLW